jgi:hypothetical protein
MSKKASQPRTLVAGLTTEQDELLRTVQYRLGTLGGLSHGSGGRYHVFGQLF